MSKVYALSGLRAAYLCAPPHQLEGLRQIQPPWEVSLPAQVAAVKALEDPAYYQQRYAETADLRARLIDDLRALDAMEIVPSTTNFLLCRLHDDRPAVATLIERCEAEGLFLRAVGSMGSGFGARDLRLAVKDAETNGRMVEIVGRALGRG
jgi:histidinol-phosphate/aromatic aminotransferase/cobyric acid decarboxylase-like protein